MKSRLYLIALLTAVFVIFILGPTSLASAATQKSSSLAHPAITWTPCTNSRFVDVNWSNGGADSCFRDNGYTGLNPHLTNVLSVDPGNNTGWVKAYPSGTTQGVRIPFYGCQSGINLNGDYDITQIAITAQNNQDC